MINIIIFYTIRSLICTIIIETIIGIILGIRNKKDILLLILANTFTNLIVTSVSFTFNYFYGITIRNISLVILELFALFAEAILYKKYFINKKINPYTLSLILNISSYSIGLIINKLF